jgi:serine/threonine-protein kinase
MHQNLIHDPDFVARFHREATAAARLNTPHAVSVLDQGSAQGPAGPVIYLVMELVRGKSLRQHLGARGRLPVPEAIEIIEPVLEALAAAHAAGIIHRDIKPENILLGDDGRVKVADFGLARPIAQPTQAITQGVVMGTVGYLSPEQVTDGTADTRSDVYAAGVVLFEMLTGQLPHSGTTPMSVAYQSVHGDVPAPSTLVPGIPPELDDLVVSSTARVPGHRPHDGGAFLDDLHQILPYLPQFAEDDDYPVSNPARPTAAFPLSAGRVNDDDPAYANGYGAGGRAQRRAADARGGGARPRLVMIAVAAGVALVLLAGFLLTRGSGGGSADNGAVAVPDVIGFSKAEAEQALTSRGLAVAYTPAEASNTIDVDDVIRQNPPSSTDLAAGGTVMLTLSAGPAPVTVPNLSGVTELSAKSQLTAAGLVAADQTRQEPSDTFAAGQVVTTDPAPGQPVPMGTVVTIVVSSGPATVVIPNDLEGLSYDQAAQRLQAVGLTASREDVEDRDSDQDEVVGVENAGGRVTAGSTVKLYVSTGGHGNGRVNVPNVMGLTVWEADSKLREAGLNPSHVNGGFLPSGKVVDQNPDAGAHVRSGSTVQLRFED